MGIYINKLLGDRVAKHKCPTRKKFAPVSLVLKNIKMFFF